jgi:deoxyribose-phosphate aldolase
MPLDMGWVKSVRINTGYIQKTAAELATRRVVKKEHQAAWQLKAITLIDLTTLNGDDTDMRVDRLCEKAKRPVRADLLKAMGVEDLNITTGAVCVYHNHIAEAVKVLAGTNIPVAAVSTNFPDGQGPRETSLAEIRASVAAGAKEIDIVITREYALSGQWEKLYEQVKQYREACGDAHLKTILGTGNLGTEENVMKASLVAMMAGADFIKTSTGKEKENANLAVSLVMMRAIRDYHDRTGYKVGYKPAGGISKAKDALVYLSMVKEELGDEWLRPELFRFGASSLLGDLEMQMEHFVTGRYSAPNRHPIP